MSGVVATSNPIFVPFTLINRAFNLGPPDASFQDTSTAPLALLEANFVPLGPARRRTPAVTPLTERHWRSLPLAPWSFAGRHRPILTPSGRPVIHTTPLPRKPHLVDDSDTFVPRTFAHLDSRHTLASPDCLRDALPVLRPQRQRRHAQRRHLHLRQLRDGRATRRRRRRRDVHQLARRLNDVHNCGHDQRPARRAPCSAWAPPTPRPTAGATRSLLRVGAGDATTSRLRGALPALRRPLQRRHAQRPHLHFCQLRDRRVTRRRRRRRDVRRLARRFSDVHNCGHDQRLARRAPCSVSAPAPPRPTARATRSLLRVGAGAATTSRLRGASMLCVGTCNAVARNVPTCICANCPTVVLPDAVADDRTCTNWLVASTTYTTAATTNGLRDALPAPRGHHQRHDQPLARRAPCSALAPATLSRAPSLPASVPPARRS